MLLAKIITTASLEEVLGFIADSFQRTIAGKTFWNSLSLNKGNILGRFAIGISEQKHNHKLNSLQAAVHGSLIAGFAGTFPIAHTPVVGTA